MFPEGYETKASGFYYQVQEGKDFGESR